ncbi:MAG TPA: hypothetical protein VMH26_16010 [Burkholderiales bacterium]|nr:hypothetical protein [Burkholderiales bacterium]
MSFNALRVAPLAALIAAFAMAPADAQPIRLHHYSVALDPGLAVIRVRACFAGTPPRRLVAESLEADYALEKAQLEGARRVFEPNGTEMRLGTLPDNACIAYSVDLGRFKGRSERPGRPRRHVGSDLVTDLGTWFWRPDSLEPDEDIDVEFDLPAGISVSAPWQMRAMPGEGTVYRVGHSPYDWPAAVAFGRFTEHVVDAPQAQLRVAVLEGQPRVDEVQIVDWLRRAAFAVTTLYGRFPVASVQVLVIPGARGSEPVPWAYVLRGGGPSAHFFINQERPRHEFDADWTAVHELSHLLLPYVLSADAWLSEGTASYYEHVLRARAGSIAPAQAWQRLHDGFTRGMQSARGLTLADATERMYRSGSFMRVYWEGAAIMLLADQRLRARTEGRQSLDSALDQLARCCLSPQMGWGGRDLFRKLDELTGTTVFAELYESHVRSASLPDVAQAYRLLGLQVTAAGEVVLLDDAPQRADRDAIMRAAGPVSGPEGQAPSAGAAQSTLNHNE